MNSNEDNRGVLWKLLPDVKSNQLGNRAPSFGIGAGCGFGLAAGVFGGTGLGMGIPGLQLGFGLGAGCGVGIGFGYGVGKGIAFRRHSNAGSRVFNGRGIFTDNTRDEIGPLVEELVVNTKKLVQATLKEVDKWSKN